MISKSVHIQLLTSGARKGLHGFWWMFKIIVPVSLATTLLDASGWMLHVEFLIEPVLGLLQLPSEAAYPLLAGMLTGVYGGVAAMAVLPFTPDQMTLIAIFLLISHNLIQEGIIQAKSGIHPLCITLFRLGTSVLVVYAVMQCLDIQPVLATSSASIAPLPRPLVDTLYGWGAATLRLSITIFLIFISVMILLEEMKHHNLVIKLVDLFHPCLKILGLDKSVGILWMTAAIFGIAYGSAVIIQEVREKPIEKSNLTRLHLSIGINHSLIDDPVLFLPLGLNPFWLWVPKIVAAIILVNAYNFMARMLAAFKMTRLKVTGGFE